MLKQSCTFIKIKCDKIMTIEVATDLLLAQRDQLTQCKQEKLISIVTTAKCLWVYQSKGK